MTSFLGTRHDSRLRPVRDYVVAGNPRLRSVLAIIRALSVPEQDAWMQAGRRIAQGMPFAEAEAAMWQELERTPQPFD
jgi:hypothetical protein